MLISVPPFCWKINITKYRGRIKGPSLVMHQIKLKKKQLKKAVSGSCSALTVFYFMLGYAYTGSTLHQCEILL